MPFDPGGMPPQQPVGGMAPPGGIAPQLAPSFRPGGMGPQQPAAPVGLAMEAIAQQLLEQQLAEQAQARLMAAEQAAQAPPPNATRGQAQEDPEVRAQAEAEAQAQAQAQQARLEELLRAFAEPIHSGLGQIAQMLQALMSQKPPPAEICINVPERAVTVNVPNVAMERIPVRNAVGDIVRVLEQPAKP